MVAVRRDNGAKVTLKNENLESNLQDLLNTIHDDMYNRALVERDNAMVRETDREWDGKFTFLVFELWLRIHTFTS